VDVFTSDAHDLWYFTDRKRGRVGAPFEEWIDGARVRRLPIQHFPFQHHAMRVLGRMPGWKHRCRFAPYMPLIPGIEGIRGDYDLACALGFPFTIFSLGAWRTARAARAPLVLTPFLHLSTPGDPVHREYTRPHQIRMLSEADAVIVQTKLEAEAVVQFGISRERVVKLGMAVDHGAVTGGVRTRARRRWGLVADAIVVGQLGALDPNKGTCDLVRAIALLNAQRASDRLIHLVLAGHASPEFERFLTTLGPGSRTWLTLLGAISNEDRPDFYAGLDLFSMPSRTDSFGIVFLEAWANGLPVVAAAAGGVVDVVDDGRTGLLVPFGRPDVLARTLDRVIHEDGLRERLGRAGAEEVRRARYDWNDRAAVLERLFGALATSGKTLRRDRARARMPIPSASPTRTRSQSLS
jgi:glycosyltransferase involved in cell wall biosynthesis